MYSEITSFIARNQINVLRVVPQPSENISQVEISDNVLVLMDIWNPINLFALNATTYATYVPGNTILLIYPNNLFRPDSNDCINCVPTTTRQLSNGECVCNYGYLEVPGEIEC